MIKAVWLSYDLGVKGDYEGLYKWLASNEAIECGDSLAYFKLNIDKEENIPNAIKTKLGNEVGLNKSDRIYVIWKEGQKIKGSFIFGSRKAPPWEGYKTEQVTTEESV